MTDWILLMMKASLWLSAIVFSLQAVAAADPMTVTIRAGGRTGPGYADGASGVSGYGGPSGVAVDSVGNVYVADRVLHTIRRITPAGETTTFAGKAGEIGQVNGRGAAARFTNPFRIAIDSSGNVYVSEEYTYRLLRISPEGVVSTVVSSLPASPDALAVDAIGNVFFAGYREIFKVTPAGVVSLFAAEAANHIASLAFDSNGVLYAGTNVGTIVRVVPSGAHTVFASLGWDMFTGLKIDASGIMYGCLLNSNQIVRVTPAGVISIFAGDGAQGSVDGPAASARFLFPRDLVLTASGDVYVVEDYQTTVRKVTQSQIVSTIGGSVRQRSYVNGDLTTVRFQMPIETVGDANGNLFVADLRSIRKIAADGSVTLFAGHPFEGGDIDGLGTGARFNDIAGLTIDSIGNLYVTTSGHVIRRISPSGFVFTLAGLTGVRGSDNGNGSDARFWSPQGLVTDPAGNLYVADGGNSLIRMVAVNGDVSTVAGLANTPGDLDGTGSAARFRRPAGVTVDDSGVIYVADSAAHTIRKMTMPGGVVTTLAGSGWNAGAVDGNGATARFRSPYDVEFMAGHLYVADGGNRLLRAVTLAGEVSTVAGSAFAGNVEGTGPIAAMSGSNRMGKDNAGSLILTDQLNANVSNVRAPGIPDVATASSTSPAIDTVVLLSTDVETATSWQWSVLRRPAGSSAQLTSLNTRNTSFTPDVADTFVFLLRAEGVAGIRFSTVEVTPTDGCDALASVVATLSGAASVCLTATTSATATVVVGGGGSPAIQWGWRATPNGSTTAIAGETSPMYVLNGADFGSAGTFYLLATVTSTCGVSMVSNPIAIEVTAPPNAAISGSSGVFASQSLNFAFVANGGEGATYAWSITNGTITAGASSNFIQYTAGESGAVILNVTVTRNGCSASDELAVPILTRNGSASLFYLVVRPCRVIDTRGSTALASNATRIVNVGGACGVPVGATAVAVNLTVVGPTTTGFLALYPSNAPWPGTSTINYRPGKTRANSAVVRVAPDGTLAVLNNGATTHFLIDVTGYFR